MVSKACLEQFDLKEGSELLGMKTLWCAEEGPVLANALVAKGYNIRGIAPQAVFPILTYPKDTFDLALCSYFLFTESQLLSTRAHQQVLLELCRVAQEVRIFPLTDKAGHLSMHIGPLLQYFQEGDVQIEIKKVPWQGLAGEDVMMRIYKKSCHVMIPHPK